MKVMTIVGTRPELIKLSETIKKIDVFFEHILVHTGQNYDYSLNKVFFENFSLREPDYYLNVSGGNLGESIGSVISETYNVMVAEKPDALLLLGDTNSCLSAISAKRLKIPIFHLEAGNRCFDENLPEEINRKIIDHTSDINLCYTNQAKQNLLNEGLSMRDTFVVGSPMREILNTYDESIENSNILEKLKLKNESFFVFSAHREENIDNDKSFENLILTLQAIDQHYKLPIVFSAHPRTRKKIIENNISFSKNIILSEPFGFFDYLKLQKNSKCVLSDSGTLSEESAILGFPSVSLRNSTERPESIDKGSMLIGNKMSEGVIKSIQIATYERENMKYDIFDYADENFSMKIVKIIQGYTHIVNEFKWRK